MASKWKNLKGRFPVATKDEAFELTVARAQEGFTGLRLKGLLAVLAERDRKKDALNDYLREVNADITALNRLILAEFEAQGVSSVRSDGGITFHERIDVGVGVEAPDVFFAYLNEHPELEYLYDVKTSDVTTLVKDLLEEGKDEEIPPGLKIYLRTSVGMKGS